MADSFDPYKVLQVDPEADPEVIQAAYRRLAQKYHPDLAAGPARNRAGAGGGGSGAGAAGGAGGAGGARGSGDRMVAINRAWAILRDPVARAAHDAERARAAGSSAAPAPAPDEAPPSNRGRAAAEHGAGAGWAATPASRSAETGPGETGSSSWTSGRSPTGSGYDPATMRASDGFAAAGPPPGSPSGSVLNFGRFAGWSLGEIARRDLEYIEWLDRTPIGRPYRDEIDAILRRTGRRRPAEAESAERRGLFRRR